MLVTTILIVIILAVAVLTILYQIGADQAERGADATRDTWEAIDALDAVAIEARAALMRAALAADRGEEPSHE
jgi:hypothetical protein